MSNEEEIRSELEDLYERAEQLFDAQRELWRLKGDGHLVGLQLASNGADLTKLGKEIDALEQALVRISANI
jgi:transposase